ncbi:hypothetical protein ACHAPI_011134 [Fusarium lateritium]
MGFFSNLPLVPVLRQIRNVGVTRRELHTNKALVIDGKGLRLDHHRAVPYLGDDYILVKPTAIALNPTDWRNVKAGRGRDGCIVGCDYAGVVEAVGASVTKSWKPGDRVFGCGHGSNFVNPDDGVFAERAAVIGDLQMRVPDGLSFEKAATLGLGSITVGQGLYQKGLKLQLPSSQGTNNNSNRKIPVLIYGGTTATGALAIQFAKLSNYTVITTCSASNAEYVKSIGADFVIDYHDEDAGAQIRELTGNKLEHAWDTVSIEKSARICADALTTLPGLNPVYGTVLPVKSPRADVSTISTVMYTTFGKDFEFGPVHMPASKEDYEFGVQFFNLVESLVAQGRLKPHNHQVRKGGLGGVIQGLQDLENGTVRVGKLVYLIDDTANE